MKQVNDGECSSSSSQEKVRATDALQPRRVKTRSRAPRGGSTSLNKPVVSGTDAPYAVTITKPRNSTVLAHTMLAFQLFSSMTAVGPCSIHLQSYSGTWEQDSGGPLAGIRDLLDGRGTSFIFTIEHIHHQTNIIRRSTCSALSAQWKCWSVRLEKTTVCGALLIGKATKQLRR